MQIFLNIFSDCWAFSAVCAIEGQLGKLTGKYTSLSEQQITDCDTKDSGCNGGDPGSAYDYILSTPSKGIDLTSAYSVSFYSEKNISLNLQKFF